MATYLETAIKDEESAIEIKEKTKQYRSVLFHAEQSAEKYAKHILESVNPESRNLKSHNIESVLLEYDSNIPPELKYSANHLSSYYFDTRYPGDNYVESVTLEMAEQALNYLKTVKDYCISEISKFATEPVNTEDLESCSEFINNQQWHNASRKSTDVYSGFFDAAVISA